MKKLYLILLITGVVLAGCSKRDYIPADPDPEYWMRTHDKATVAYVDYTTGNYIVDTYSGYSVVESWSGVIPREYDREYANFNNRGIQTVYNRTGNYFTEVRVIESWLTWSEAMYILDEISQ
jgi:hypothetical protein